MRRTRASLATLWIGLVLGACSQDDRRAETPPDFVGVATCSDCHAVEVAAWRKSHHDLAMQEATEETVRGNFEGTTFTYAGVTSTFFRRDRRFFVRTDGPDGRLADFEIAYTFGVEPLQQLLIPFPGGRLQALGIAWDSRPGGEGGQHWFHLYPGDSVDFRHELHWTRAAQTWNAGCAACHSTGLRKGYDPEADRYTTTWHEIDVSCEACHGPGSRHVEWARAGDGSAGLGLPIAFHDRREILWVMDSLTGIARRSQAPRRQLEVEACGRCHSLRTPIRADHVWGRPLLETHRPELVLGGLYFPDGQIRDEVYEYGSFRQSRMYAAGVTCSDCHDPHALSLRGEGNAVCAQCHLPSRFDTPDHHLHAPGSPGSRCVACHMPERTYMVVDHRRDHSIRIPRPDLADRLGTPSACAACHADRSNAWAARAVEKAHGPPGRPPAFAAAFAADDRRSPEAGRALAEVGADPTLPAILEASVLARLGSWPGAASRELLLGALTDPEPLVRLGGLVAVAPLVPEQRLSLAGPALRDSVLGVRQEAVRVLASVPDSLLRGDLRAAFDRASGEYLAGLEANADRPWALLEQAAWEAARGDVEAAIKVLRQALARHPDDPDLLAGMVTAARARGHTALALEHAERLRSLYPDDPRIRRLVEELGKESNVSSGTRP